MVPSRRQFIAAVSAAGLAALTGCSGGSSSASGYDCATSNGEHGEPDVLHGGTFDAEGERVRLEVSLLREARSRVERIEVRNMAGDLQYSIRPLRDPKDVPDSKYPDGVVTYAIDIGHRPLHDQYRLVAVGADGPLDWVSVSGHCRAED